MTAGSVILEENADGTFTEQHISKSPTQLNAAVAWDGVTDKPSTFTPSTHSHAESDVTSLTTDLADKVSLQRFDRISTIENDCLRSTVATGFAPFLSAVIASGTIVAGTGTANHPGITRFRSSTTTNSGLYIAGDVASMLIAGGEECEFVFMVETTANSIIKLGWGDSLTYADHTDGVWIHIAGTTLDGACKNNSGPTRTGTSYTITQGVWYRAKITVNSDATLATFTVYTCSNGASVWTDTVNANIPTATGRELGPNMVATNTGTTQVYVLSLDWYRYSCSRTLVR